MARKPLLERMIVLPFRAKLTATTMAVTAIALLMSCLGLMGAQYFYDRDNASRQNIQLSEVLASNLGAAVVFQDRATADSITHSARAVPDVVLIEARDASGQRVSRYETPDLTDAEREQILAAREPGSVQSSLGSGIGSYSTPITVNEDTVGTLVIGFRHRSLTSIIWTRCRLHHCCSLPVCWRPIWSPIACVTWHFNRSTV